MDNHTRNKDIGAPGNGGRFASPGNSAPEVSMQTPARRTIVVTGARVPTDHSADPLPFPLPHLGEPEVDYDTDDVTGQACVYVRVGDFDVMLTRDPYEGWQLGSLAEEDFGFFFGKDGKLTQEQRDQFEELADWAREVAERIEETDNSYVFALRDDEALRAEVVAAALGKPAPIAVDERPAPVAALDRASKVLAALYDNGDDEEASVQDALTDLIHYAGARGLDFDDILGRAGRIAQDEIKNPTL